MLKKTITFEDLEGNEITEDFYFNLSKAELVELELSEQEGFAEMLQKIVEEEDRKKIVEHFKQIILMTVGERDPNGRGFNKSPEIAAKFAALDAYSVLFVELATDEGAAAAFINGVAPKGLRPQLQAADIQLPTAPPVLETSKTPEADTRPLWMQEDRDPTPKELATMPREELLLAMQTKNKKNSTT